MPDPFRDVRPGEALVLSAPTWNAVLDAARAFQDGGGTGNGETFSFPRNASIVRIKNESGVDLLRGNILGLGPPIFTPDQSVDAFLREVTFRGIAPSSTHASRFGVLLEPLNDGHIGRAAVAGVCAARVDVIETDHEYAIADGSTEALFSSESGGARILWREGETDPYGGYDTGLQWALIAFGAQCSGEDEVYYG